MEERHLANSKIKSVEVIEVIKTVSLIGKGTEANPNRYLIQFWSLDGQQLAEHDTIHDQVDHRSAKIF